MITSFLNHIRKYVELLSEEVEAVKDSLPVKTFSKGTILLGEGDISGTTYFNVKGCVRSYHLVDGEEKTTHFYTENRFVVAFNSLLKKQPSKLYFDCLEDTTLVVITLEVEQEIFKNFPKFEQVNRMIMEEELGVYQDTLSSYITQKPEERYYNLLKQQPELVKRVPQYYLASYLGVKPESLSRIRKRISVQ